MKTLKGLAWPERQRRHAVILQAFERHGAENLPWMATTSPNDPDQIMEITDVIREPVGVYSWFSEGNWISISVSQIAQSIDGRYQFLEFGKGRIGVIARKEEGFVIDGILFRCPPQLADIYVELTGRLEAMSRQAPF